MPDRAGDDAPIRHIPYAAAPGTGPFFGDHYITQHERRYDRLAPQFMITVYPAGDKTLPVTDPMMHQPHVHVQVYTAGQWATRARISIEK